MAIFFSSDIHFDHKNILLFEDRPFETIEEMNAGIIEAWNNKVSKNDTVKYLGDFCFGSYDRWVELIEQLNGQIEFIKGNHDNSSIITKLHANGYLKELYPIGQYMKINKYILHLTHYPMEIGNRPRMFSLHGHIHNYSSKMANQVNLCVDSPVDFNRKFGEPIHLDELMKYLDLMNPIIEKNFNRERGN